MNGYSTLFYKGIMWARVETDINRSPVHLGDRIVIPGDVFDRIGKKGHRASFDCGEPFRYVGSIDNLLLFQFLSDGDSHPWYPAMCFIDSLTLLVCNGQNGSAFDVRV